MERTLFLSVTRALRCAHCPKGQVCGVVRGSPGWPQDGGSWTQAMQGVLVPVTPRDDTVANQPERGKTPLTRPVSGISLRIAAVLCLVGALTTPAVPSIKNWAVVVSAGSKLQDVPLADLAKLCQGTQKAWPDGKTFALVISDPESPEMKVPVQKLLGLSGEESKAAIAKLKAVKIVDTEADLLRTVQSTPGAVGIVDVYSINSSVKVLRVDGKLPFDLGYVLKGI